MNYPPPPTPDIEISRSLYLGPSNPLRRLWEWFFGPPDQHCFHDWQCCYCSVWQNYTVDESVPGHGPQAVRSVSRSRVGEICPMRSGQWLDAQVAKFE